jgi:hypothetical protein
MVCTRGMLATGRAAYRRRGSSNARSLCGFGCMVLRFELPSTNDPAPRPLAIPLRTKRNLAAECAGL